MAFQISAEVVVSYLFSLYAKYNVPSWFKHRSRPAPKMKCYKGKFVEIVFFLLISIMQLQLKSYKLEILTELRPLTTKTFWLVLLSGF